MSSNVESENNISDPLEDLISSNSDETSVPRQSFSQEMLRALLDHGVPKDTIAKTVRTSIPTINRILKYPQVNPSPRLFSRLLSFYFANCYFTDNKIN